MYCIKAKFLDTGRVLQVEGIWENGINRDDLIVVSSERGEEIVRVIGVSKEPSPSRVTFLRKAREEDIRKMEENRDKAMNFYNVCREKIIKHKLSMKLIKAYIPIDDTKVFFYYTAEERIDFRGLVKDMARVVKKRIEMRQIGVRDAIKMMGWLGTCGDVPCCIRFAEDFESISLKDIENQNLPLSSAKFTGPCGRLICCLAYERNNYTVKTILPEIGTEFCFEGKTLRLLYVDPLMNKVIVEVDGKKEDMDIKLLLPFGYEKALKHCCCKYSKEDDVISQIHD
ncbi:MAG: stage 0 sporulation family protein [Aquificaceae bacterium]